MPCARRSLVAVWRSPRACASQARPLLLREGEGLAAQRVADYQHAAFDLDPPPRLEVVGVKVALCCSEVLRVHFVGDATGGDIRVFGRDAAYVILNYALLGRDRECG